jgi:hypothetical protein
MPRTCIVKSAFSRRPQGGQGGRPSVVQPTRFGLVLNLQTTRALGIDVQPTLPAVADEAKNFGRR